MNLCTLNLHFHEWITLMVKDTKKFSHMSTMNNFRECFFIHRLISIWNSVPKYIVNADSVKSLKDALDKIWNNQDKIFNWRNELSRVRCSGRH